MAIDAKALAAAKLSARRARVRRVRRMVVAGAVALFVAVWGVIFTTLVSGHDPVLAAKAQTSAAAATSASSSSGNATSGTSSGSSSSGSPNSSGSTSSVTTGQS